MSGINIGDELNGAGLSWGWFEGGFRPPTSFTDAATATECRPATSTFMPERVQNAGSTTRTALLQQGILQRSHRCCAGLSARWRQVAPVRLEGRLHPAPPPFQYYASSEPHHVTLPTTQNGTVPLSALKTIGTTPSTTSTAGPQFDTPNHQYDTSDFDQLVSGIGKGDLPPSSLPAVSF